LIKELCDLIRCSDEKNKSYKELAQRLRGGRHSKEGRRETLRRRKLISRNTKDFKDIEGLQLIDPYEL